MSDEVSPVKMHSAEVEMEFLSDDGKGYNVCAVFGDIITTDIEIPKLSRNGIFRLVIDGHEVQRDRAMLVNETDIGGGLFDYTARWYKLAGDI